MANINVWCNLAHGFVMELIEKSDHKLLPAQRSENIVQIAGANSLRVKGTNPLALPFASTSVEEGLAREWFKRNKGLAFVKNGSAYIQETTAGAGVGMAKDRAGLKTGMEPLDPDKIQPGVTADKEHMASFKSTVL